MQAAAFFSHEADMRPRCRSSQLEFTTPLQIVKGGVVIEDETRRNLYTRKSRHQIPLSINIRGCITSLIILGPGMMSKVKQKPDFLSISLDPTTMASQLRNIAIIGV